MFTTLNVAHKWSKNPPFYKRLTTLENAHNRWKCSQPVKMLTTLENVHNARKCSQRLKMFTTLENAHNTWKCSQLVKMLTTLENHNLPNANNIGFSYNFWNRLQNWTYNTPNRCTHKSSKRSQLSISPKLCVNSSPPTWNFCDRH